MKASERSILVYLIIWTAKQMKNFAHAEAAANMSDFARARVGCVVVAGNGRVLASGFSTHRSHPLQSYYDRYRQFRDGCGAEPSHSLHAEISALSQLVDDKSIDWNRVEVYVYRLRRDQPYGMARPCAACMACLRDLGVRHLFYTTDDGYAYENLREERKCA